MNKFKVHVKQRVPPTPIKRCGPHKVVAVVVGEDSVSHLQSSTVLNAAGPYRSVHNRDQ